VVDVDSRAHHSPHVVDMSAFAGRDHRYPVEPVAQGRVRPGRQQYLEHRDGPGDAGDQPGAVLLVVLRVWIGTERNQQPRDVKVVGRGSQQQRSPFAVIAGLDGCSARSAIAIWSASPDPAARTSSAVAAATSVGRADWAAAADSAGLSEDLVTTVAGMLDGRAAVTGDPLQIGPARDERANGVLIGGTAVAVDDRFVQCRPPGAVDVIHRDARAQQPVDDGGVPAFGGADHPGAP
jgi:hypothetical protein